jgi:hypothetical protein
VNYCLKHAERLSAGEGEAAHEANRFDHYYSSIHRTATMQVGGVKVNARATMRQLRTFLREVKGVPFEERSE